MYIYKHICKTCETKFYVEDLLLLSIARCPKCKSDTAYISEHKVVNKQ